MKNPVSVLRLVALFEAVSFLVLLGIAMPLKYHWGMPMAVRIAGSVHGALFLAYCWALWRCFDTAKWPFNRTAKFFAASLIPLAPFFLDPQLRQHAAEFEMSNNK